MGRAEKSTETTVENMLGSRAMDSSYWRLLAACGLASVWWVLLFGGWIAGGAIHLLLVAAALLGPWRSLRGGESRD